MSEFTEIVGLSDKRRLPRLGKVHLGIKKKNSSGKEYPSEVDHFVFEDNDMGEACRAIFGPTPKVLDVIFPTDQRGQIFPQAYKKWGASGLQCIGDGEKGKRRIEGEAQFQPVTCPGPDTCDYAKKDCKRVANLHIVLYTVSVGGTFQIDTSSINSIIDINSGLDYVEEVCQCLRGVPLKLARVLKATTHDGKKSNHWTLQIRIPTHAEMGPLLDQAHAITKLLAQNLGVEPAKGREQDLFPVPADQAASDGPPIKTVAITPVERAHEPEPALDAHNPNPANGEPAKPAAKEKPKAARPKPAPASKEELENLGF